MIGRTIGSYEVVEKVGEGGMGSVYRAVDRMLDREVAIKAIRPELAREPEILERFRFEAKTLARVSHPAIATIYSFFQEGEELFLAMEFVRGRTLSAVLRDSGPLPWERAVDLLASALEGIERAHRLGIVHRDLKPDNLMIDESGTLKVMDFGIARAVGSGRLTRTGLLVGTLRYIAPEQIRGEDVDQRTDIYSLGVVLFEMVTGSVPFESSNDYAILRAQIEDPPAPPSSVAPQLPEWLDHAVLRALAKEPAARFQTAEEMRAFLVARGIQPAIPPGAAAVAPAPSSPGPSSPSLEEQTRRTSRPASQPTEAGAGPDTSLDETLDLPKASRPKLTPPPLPQKSPAVSAVTTASAPNPAQSSYRPVQLGRPGSPVWKIATAAVLLLILGGIGLSTWLRRGAGGSPSASPELVPAGADSSLPPSSGISTEPSAAAPSSTAPAPSALPRPSSEAGEANRRLPPPERPRQPAPQPQPPATEPEPARTEPETSSADVPPESSSGPSSSADTELPFEELRRLGGELPAETGKLFASYEAFLEKKETSGLDLTEEDELLLEELEALDEAAVRFNQAFKTGPLARLRRMGRSEADQLQRRAGKLAERGGRIESLMAQVQPDAEVQQHWRDVRRRWRRVAEIFGR